MGISITIRFVYGYYDPTGDVMGLPVTGWDEENDRPAEGPCGCVVELAAPMGSRKNGVVIYVKGSEVPTTQTSEARSRTSTLCSVSPPSPTPPPTTPSWPSSWLLSLPSAVRRTLRAGFSTPQCIEVQP